MQMYGFTFTLYMRHYCSEIFYTRLSLRIKNKKLRIIFYFIM